MLERKRNLLTRLFLRRRTSLAVRREIVPNRPSAGPAGSGQTPAITFAENAVRDRAAASIGITGTLARFCLPWPSGRFPCTLSGGRRSCPGTPNWRIPPSFPPSPGSWRGSYTASGGRSRPCSAAGSFRIENDRVFRRHSGPVASALPEFAPKKRRLCP